MANPFDFWRVGCNFRRVRLFRQIKIGYFCGSSFYPPSHKTREDLLHQREIINNQQVHKLVPMGKPVIYLYPEEKTEVAVKLDYDGELTATYPDYRNGWHFIRPV